MRIDAHQHFWLMENRCGCWPPSELAAIYRDFLPPDIQTVLAKNAIDGTVVVQSLPNSDDTHFLLDLASRTPFILGVVGWIELKDPGAPEVIASLAANPKFKGVRPMLQDITETDWINDQRLDPAVRALCDYDLTFDALVTPRHFQPLIEFAERHPQLLIVVDHGAKPDIEHGTLQSWRSQLGKLARLPNVHCKLSGLLTEAGNQPPEAVRPYAETILELFGPERTIWGSDWPVLNLASSFQSWLEQCQEIVPLENHGSVFGGNAMAFYRLGQTAGLTGEQHNLRAPMQHDVAFGRGME